MAPWKRAALGFVWVILAAPVAVIVTAMLFPFWNWFESVSGIESMGHSGPANWCFVAVYAILVVAIFVAGWSRGKRPQKRVD